MAAYLISDGTGEGRRGVRDLSHARRRFNRAWQPLLVRDEALGRNIRLDGISAA